MKKIPLNECRHGFTYRINSRNLRYGVYNEVSKGFTGIRYKFGDRFLFTELHYDVGPPFGTVHPIEELEQCPIEDLRESNSELMKYLEGVKV